MCKVSRKQHTLHRVVLLYTMYIVTMVLYGVFTETKANIVVYRAWCWSMEKAMFPRV